MNDRELLLPIIKRYYQSFSLKQYNDENNEHDFLMDLFNISPDLKRQNRQYWGRELGMLWQLLVVELAQQHCRDFKPALQIERDEPCDLIIGQDAIDTKYRIGSGDSGTLKKFKQYGSLLRGRGLRPVLLIVRNDNLSAAIAACKVGGWTIYTGADSIQYLYTKIGVDIISLLSSFGETFHITK